MKLPGAPKRGERMTEKTLTEAKELFLKTCQEIADRATKENIHYLRGVTAGLLQMLNKH